MNRSQVSFKQAYIQCITHGLTTTASALPSLQIYIHIYIENVYIQRIYIYIYIEYVYIYGHREVLPEIEVYFDEAHTDVRDIWTSLMKKAEEKEEWRRRLYTGGLSASMETDFYISRRLYTDGLPAIQIGLRIPSEPHLILLVLLLY